MRGGFRRETEANQPCTGREQIDLRAKAITLDEDRRNGKPGSSSSSVSVSPSHAQHGISGVRRQPPKQQCLGGRHCKLHVSRNAPHNALHGDSLRATAKARSPNEDSEGRPAGSTTSIVWLACPTTIAVERSQSPIEARFDSALGCTGAPAVCWWRPRASSPFSSQRSRAAKRRNSATTESSPSKGARNFREKSRERYKQQLPKEVAERFQRRAARVPASRLFEGAILRRVRSISRGASRLRSGCGKRAN